MATSVLIRVVLANSQSLIRKGLEAKLGESTNFRLVGSFSSGKEVFEFLENNTADVILVDEDLSDPNGYDTIKKLTKRNQENHCILLSQNYNLRSLKKGLIAGAKGYICKEEDLKIFEMAILSVFGNRVHFRSEEIVELVRQISDKELAEKNTPMSPRETQVFTYLVAGLLEKEIADKLKISRETVHHHRKRIYKKTGARNATELILYSVRLGLIP